MKPAAPGAVQRRDRHGARPPRGRPRARRNLRPSRADSGGEGRALEGGVRPLVRAAGRDRRRPRSPGKGGPYLTVPGGEPFADPDVFAHPAILGVLDRVFAQEYVMVQLGADGAEPGAENQEVHRDYRPLFDDSVVTPLYALAVNFPLVEVTRDNGPFTMARGTHVLSRDEGLRRTES